MNKTNKWLKLLLVIVLFIAVGIGGTAVQKFSGRYTDLNRKSKLVSTEINDSATVHVKGAVKNAGTYTLTEGDRVSDAIKSAGGASDGADLDRINLARVIKDGDEIFVPKSGEDFSITPSGAVNINSADVETLKTIPGISDTLAQKIYNYRAQNGNFENLEDIINVKGIGDKTFAKIKSYITVQ